MKRFKVTVRTSAGYLTVDGSSVKLTGVCSEIIAQNQDDLTHQLKEFLSEVRPFQGLATGISKEDAEEILLQRKNFQNALGEFHLNRFLWDQINFRTGCPQWEIILEFQGNV